jgi:hypothetical protein
MHATHVFAFASHYIKHKPVQDFNIWCVLLFFLAFARSFFVSDSTGGVRRLELTHATTLNKQVSNVRTCVSEIADMHAFEPKFA